MRNRFKPEIAAKTLISGTETGPWIFLVPRLAVHPRWRASVLWHISERFLRMVPRNTLQMGLMRKNFSFVLFLIVLCVLFDSASSAETLPAIDPKHIHLSLSSTSKQMNVVWYTEERVEEAVIQYGPEHDELSSSNSASSAVSRQLTYGEGFIHRATMYNLKPDTTYYYRVGRKSLPSRWSQIYHFHTRKDASQLKADDKVTMLAYGDMGVFPNSLESVSLIAEREIETGLADIVLHVGDLAYAFGNFTKWNMWFESTQALSAYVPYMLSIGNRDEPIIFQERFVMPLDRIESTAVLKPESRQNFYYSFDYNWVHVTSLSINDSYLPESDQYKWIEQDLKRASERMEDPHDNLQWIVFIGHTPMYSSSNGHKGGNKELKSAIEDLFVKYNVTLAVWGDDHVYERSWPLYNDVPDTEHREEGDIHHFIAPDRPIHLLAGTSGIELDGWISDDPPDWSAVRLLAHGYVKIEASKHILNVKFLRKDDGSIGDEFMITKRVRAGLTIHWLVWAAPIMFGLFFFGRRNRFFNPSMIVTQESKST